MERLSFPHPDLLFPERADRADTNLLQDHLSQDLLPVRRKGGGYHFGWNLECDVVKNVELRQLTLFEIHMNTTEENIYIRSETC